MGWFFVESPPSPGEQYEGLLMAFADPLWAYWEIITVVISILAIWKLSGAKGMPVLLQSMFFMSGEQNPKNVTPNTTSTATAVATTAISGVNVLYKMKLPEKWILHTLIFSVFMNSFFLIFIYFNYLFNTPLPVSIIWIMDVLVPLRETLIDHTSAFLCMHMLWFHSLRQFWEEYFFENRPRGNIHFAYYLGKYLFSGAVLLTFLSEAPGFGPQQPWVETTSPSFYLEWYHVLGLIAFGYFSYRQRKVIKLVADLRKDDHDNVAGVQNIIPLEGGGFEHVSCPHYLFEILIYLSILLEMGFHHAGWWLTCFCVAVNYAFGALLTHRQYTAMHQDYPRQRKALIPYIL